MNKKCMKDYYDKLMNSHPAVKAAEPELAMEDLPDAISELSELVGELGEVMEESGELLDIISKLMEKAMEDLEDEEADEPDDTENEAEDLILREQDGDATVLYVEPGSVAELLPESKAIGRFVRDNGFGALLGCPISESLSLFFDAFQTMKDGRGVMLLGPCFIAHMDEGPEPANLTAVDLMQAQRYLMKNTVHYADDTGHGIFGIYVKEV